MTLATIPSLYAVYKGFNAVPTIDSSVGSTNWDGTNTAAAKAIFVTDAKLGGLQQVEQITYISQRTTAVDGSDVGFGAYKILRGVKGGSVQWDGINLTTAQAGALGGNYLFGSYVEDDNGLIASLTPLTVSGSITAVVQNTNYATRTSLSGGNGVLEFDGGDFRSFNSNTQVFLVETWGVNTLSGGPGALTAAHVGKQVAYYETNGVLSAIFIYT